MISIIFGNSLYKDLITLTVLSIEDKMCSELKRNPIIYEESISYDTTQKRSKARIRLQHLIRMSSKHLDLPNPSVKYTQHFLKRTRMGF